MRVESDDQYPRNDYGEGKTAREEADGSMRTLVTGGAMGVFWAFAIGYLVYKGWLWQAVKGVAIAFGALSLLYVGVSMGVFIHGRIQRATTHKQDTDSDSGTHLSAVPDDGDDSGSWQ